MGLVRSAALDDPAAIRHAGRELLALALMDARNALLALLPALQATGDAALLRRLLQAGAWPEWWISRHVQRHRGEAADAAAPRLPGVEPRLEAWLAGDELPDAPALTDYLARSLELTLDLLATAPETDAGLHLYRQALRHEDRLVESLREALREGAAPPRPERAPLSVPARHWTLGTPAAGGGFVPEAERGTEAVAVPEFEIDAQPVSWARFAEFVADGGYDDDRFWSEPGRRWRAASGRRAPAFVEQLAGGVVLQRGHGARARLEKAPAQQAAAPVTRHEAEAWCRWAGRRLPTAPEWTLAAATQVRLGFAWGDVHEWVAGSARYLGAFEGTAAPAGALDVPRPGHGVLCGAGWATPPRWRHAGARRFAEPGDDAAGSGFRSCAF
jgi:formylglycine-generating enzyme required for sulfatase activity